jgi:hypothetical protein
MGDWANFLMGFLGVLNLVKNFGDLAAIFGIW